MANSMLARNQATVARLRKAGELVLASMAGVFSGANLLAYRLVLSPQLILGFELVPGAGTGWVAGLADGPVSDRPITWRIRCVQVMVVRSKLSFSICKLFLG